jgi:hypothetical protein
VALRIDLHHAPPRDRQHCRGRARAAVTRGHIGGDARPSAATPRRPHDLTSTPTSRVPRCSASAVGTLEDRPRARPSRVQWTWLHGYRTAEEPPTHRTGLRRSAASGSQECRNRRIQQSVGSDRFSTFVMTRAHRDVGSGENVRHFVVFRQTAPADRPWLLGGGFACGIRDLTGASRGADVRSTPTCGADPLTVGRSADGRRLRSDPLSAGAVASCRLTPGTAAR